MTTTLTALQQSLLTSAATRPDGSLFPVPDGVSGTLARARKAVTLLIERDLAREVDVDAGDHAWRRDGERHIGAVITNAGREAIGAPVVADAQVRTDDVDEGAPRPTKKAQVLALLRRDEGATLLELVTATGWLPHTTRAALTGLRKTGHAIVKGKRDETTCYSLAA